MFLCQPSARRQRLHGWWYLGHQIVSHAGVAHSPALNGLVDILSQLKERQEVIVFLERVHEPLCPLEQTDGHGGVAQRGDHERNPDVEEGDEGYDGQDAHDLTVVVRGQDVGEHVIQKVDRVLERSLHVVLHWPNQLVPVIVDPVHVVGDHGAESSLVQLVLEVFEATLLQQTFQTFAHLASDAGNSSLGENVA